MAKGVEVSQTNLAGTDLKDKTFSSRALSPKSVIEIVGQVTTNGSGTASVNVNHGLAYPPAHLVFFNPGNTNAVLHPSTIGPWVDREKKTTWGVMDNFTLTVTSNASTLTLAFSGVANQIYKYKCYVFEEPAKT